MNSILNSFIFLVLFFFNYSFLWADDFNYYLHYVDLDYGGNRKPGWVRTGDMDNDGDKDIIAGGGYALFIYENDGKARGWKRFGNLDSTKQMGANAGELFDVDKDGDLDVISAKYYNDIGWWENPGGPFKDNKWKFRRLFQAEWFMHDLIRFDLNGDGILEEFVANLNKAYWKTDLKLIGFWISADQIPIAFHFPIEPGRNEGEIHCHAGLDAGDINRDGKIDLAYSNGWYKAPKNPVGKWTWYPVSDVYGISNSLLRDMDDDGDLDLIVSAGHHARGVYWYENNLGNSRNNWKKHIIDDSIINPEGLIVIDMDGDRDLEVTVCDLDFKQWDRKVHNVYILENLGNAKRWKKHNIAPNSFPSHQLQVVDVNNDGKWDIISEGAGYKVVSYLENKNK